MKVVGVYTTVDYDVVDYLEDGGNDESLTGFTPIGFTREDVLNGKDVHEMISQVNRNDIDEIDGLERIPGFRGLQGTESKAWVMGLGLGGGVLLALFFN